MCGCRGTATSHTDMSHTDAAAGDRHATVSLRYRGARALLVRGPVTGVGYACYPGDTIDAFERDVRALVTSGAFARVD